MALQVKLVSQVLPVFQVLEVCQVHQELQA